MQMAVDVVVSRYNRPTEWTERFYQPHRDRVRVLIYDKETPSNPYNIPINRGNEASVYLKYIVDHYNSLPEYVFFIHDEEYSFKTVSCFLHFMVNNLGVYSCFDIKTVLILDYSDSHWTSDVLDSLDNWNSSQGNDSKKKFELRESFKHTD